MDIETTGLEVATEVMLEIGLQVTDVEGRFIDSFSSLVFNEGASTMVLLGDEYVKDMHTKSGLLADIEALEASNWVGAGQLPRPGLVEQRILGWLAENGLDEKKYPLCGSTINFDRAFLMRWMPTLHDWFHYRNVDVSSVKTLCAMLNPSVYASKPEHESLHRVIPDITDSINEYLFYMDNFLHVALP